MGIESKKNIYILETSVHLPQRTLIFHLCYNLTHDFWNCFGILALKLWKWRKACPLGTAHYLFGVCGWKYSIEGNNFLWRQAYRATTFFQNIYTGETENCSGGSWWLYLSAEKNDILLTILLKLRFYATVVVSRCWWDPFRMLIWLHRGPLTIPVWFYKDPTQILENSSKYPIIFAKWSIHDPELILLTGLKNVWDPKGNVCSSRTDCLWEKCIFYTKI